MDFTPIFNQLFSSLWYFIPLFIAITIFKPPLFKGLMGEFQVNLLIKLFLPKDTYHLIKNTTLPTENGTTQIDHILVSKYGIFVIETKNMKGWIFGSPKQKYWTQKIYKHSSKFQNPLHQNFKHTKTLESCLGIETNTIFSLIIFIGDSTFKTAMPENVTYAYSGIRYIKSHTTEVLTAEQVADTIDKIESGRVQRGFTTNRQHTAHVKTIVKAKTKPAITEAKPCPKCGSAMVIRVAKKGANAGNKFWGCTAFPKCRAIINVT